MAKRNSSNTPDRDEGGRLTNEGDHSRYGSRGGNDGWQSDPQRPLEIARGDRSEGYRGYDGNRYEQDEDSYRSSRSRQSNR